METTPFKDRGIMRFFRSLLILALTASAFGCSVDSFIESKMVEPKRSNTYQIGSINSQWTTLQGSLADVAYVNKGNEATISLNSTCEKYQDNPLKQLMYNLLASLEDGKWEKDEYITLDGREAYRVTLRAKADGVPVRAQAVVLRKNYCVYDFIYTAKPQNYQKSLKDFEKFVGSFHAW